MRGLNTLSAVGTTNLDMGDLEFLGPGQRLYVKGADSVATATLRVKVAGVEIFSGPLAIEDGTDLAQPWTKLLACCQNDSMQSVKVEAILGGTVAGARVDFLVLNRNEPVPW